MAINNTDNKPQHHHHHHQTMDNNDSAAVSKQINTLKSLNTKLIKETAERREQVNSLVQKNTYLESEFNRSVTANDSLQTEMNSLTETVAALEIEKALLFVFLTVQVNEAVEEIVNSLESDLRVILEEKREKELEIGDLSTRIKESLILIDEERGVSARVSEEREEIRVLLDARVEEVNELVVKVTELEEKEARVLREVVELKGELDRLMKENTVSARRVELIVKEKDEIEAKLVESKGVVEGFERDIVKLREEKKAVMDEKIVQDNKNSELLGLVDELNELVERMRVEEGTLVEKLADLEKKYCASLNNEAELKSKINELVEEKKESERRIEDLVNEKSLVNENLQDVMNELQNQKLAFEKIVEQKTELESAKVDMESEIVKKDEELSVSKDMVLSLEVSNLKHIEKVKELEAESGRYKALFDEAIVEKDEVIKQLHDEKAITDGLNQSITIMEKKMEGLNEKISALTAENEKHLGEKNQLTDQCAGLVKEVADLEARFAENRVEFETKLGAAEANSNRVLNILKKTVMVCERSSGFDQENGMEEGIKEHVAGIEAIRRALMDKESRLEEMKMQVELVKSSAKKEKGFWTMVSSATTLLAAAASLAYVARAH